MVAEFDSGLSSTVGGLAVGAVAAFPPAAGWASEEADKIKANTTSKSSKAQTFLMLLLAL